jgi:hypothetical protein
MITLTRQEKIVLVLLRFVIWLLDDVLDEHKEKAFPFIPQGLWDAYCSFHKVERRIFTLEEESQAESMAGCK